MTSSPASNLRALPQPLPDTELIELVMSGRPEAAARLYDRFARDIHRMVHRLLAVDTEHDDIVQEIFIKAWQLIAKGKVRNPEVFRRGCVRSLRTPFTKRFAVATCAAGSSASKSLHPTRKRSRE